MLSSVELPADVLARVSELVRHRAGLTFDTARRSVLEGGVRVAMRRSGARNLEHYLKRLDHEQSVFDDLVAEITIGETYFFRDSEQFALLRNRILPDLFQHRSYPPLRIWSAACASGEEPYSLAIVLHQLGWLARAQVIGTDISYPLLQHARQARYSRWSLRGVPDDLTATYFKRTSDRFVLIPAIKDAVEFRYLNLAEDSYPSAQNGVGEMDLILCRNVLIYFAADRVAEVTKRLVESLTDGGWLLLGSADPLLTDLERCKVEVTPAGLAYQRGHRRSVWVPQTAPRPSATPVPRPAAPKPTVQDVTMTPVPPADPSAEATRWYAARDYRRAAGAAASALASGTDDAATRMLLINALVNCGELDEAEQACRAGRDRHGMCPELAALHAFVLLEAGHPREAETTARQALYLDPGLAVAHLALGTALVRLRDASGAQRAFRNAERLLAALPSDSQVPGVDDEPAGRLAELARTQLTLLRDAIP